MGSLAYQNNSESSISSYYVYFFGEGAWRLDYWGGQVLAVCDESMSSFDALF